LIPALHILIDNNLPRTLVDELREFWKSTFPNWKVDHENDIGKPSTLDSHWIPRLRDIDASREWIVITKDKGHGDTKDREKLPWLCKHHGHAYVIVLDSIKTSAEQKAALSSVWRDLPLVVEACERLKRERSTHVKLGRYQVKKLSVGYMLRIKNEPIQSFIKKQETPTAAVTAPEPSPIAPLKQGNLGIEAEADSN
jgi:hypothetical protein